MIEEQKHNNSTETAILPMQCYVQPFWKHSDIEIYNESNLDTMGRMPDSCIDLTVTSPPYDDLRNYKGYTFDLDAVIKDLYRVTKKGGVVVWVVADQTKNGSETTTSFKQAIRFTELGWKLHDTMIYKKLNPPPNAGNRYQQCFEYMFVFSKGKPKTANIQLRERRNKCNDKRTFRRKKFSRDADGEFNVNDYHIKQQVPKENIFKYYVGGGNSTNDKIAFQHPAIFPEQLAADHITTWTNEGDVIYEPFAGSGTTGKMAFINKRKCIMSEISLEYCELSKQRLLPYTSNIGLFV